MVYVQSEGGLEIEFRNQHITPCHGLEINTQQVSSKYVSIPLRKQKHTINIAGATFYRKRTNNLMVLLCM